MNRLAVAAFAAVVSLGTTARAEPIGSPHDPAYKQYVPNSARNFRHHTRIASGKPQGCPRAWCGCWLARYYGFTGSKARQLWLARNWASMFPRVALAPGYVAVFARGRRGGHVGKIVAVHNNGTITLTSGNDGNAVRTRARSTRGLIAVVNPQVWREARAR